MHIFLTGGAGFIGSNLADTLLDQGHTLTVADEINDYYDPAIKRRNLSAALPHPHYRLHEVSIEDKPSLERIFAERPVDAIIHLAARAGVRPSIREPLLYERANILGTLNLLELARDHGVKKFVFGSSSSVYGINSKVPFSEEDPIFKPISPYAATKDAGEKMVHVYHHLYGLDAVCLRFFTVYGPRQRPDLAIHKFTRFIDEGREIEQYGDGSTRRDYTYVTDIIQGICAALTRPLGYEVINLGESQTVSLRDLISLIEQSLGKKARIRVLPEQPGDVPITFADISKARRLLDYNPQVKIHEGIPLFVDWYRHSLPTPV
ncbi:MAG: GDP-mannose 4,6-dehydratase [Verrucomicrobiae bacterium]|nr:GDP-mannose 4,6-dehydratase [Verrucomicrobiae bacterium]